MVFSEDKARTALQFSLATGCHSLSKVQYPRTSLVVQSLGTCLSMQGMWVQSLVGELSPRATTTKPAPQLESVYLKLQSPRTLEPTCHNKDGLCIATKT